MIARQASGSRSNDIVSTSGSLTPADQPHHFGIVLYMEYMQSVLQTHETLNNASIGQQRSSDPISVTGQLTASGHC